MIVELSKTTDGFNLKFPSNLSQAEQAEKDQLVQLLRQELIMELEAI